MLGIGAELVAWMEWRSINDNLNFAAHEWLKANPDLEIVTTRLAGAPTLNGKTPTWVLSIARLAEDGSPIVWTSDDRDTLRLANWANKVFDGNTTGIIDVQIAGAGHLCAEEGAKVIESTWAMLIIAKRKARTNAAKGAESPVNTREGES